ncbi:Short chain dehydrogenase [Cladobotryum mycophilum]|uniref:Short chain dehydrogenase n=1 Tax=Cladobotryum mycophilum TaxID=491253 RepID=A0ABR0SH55_9HYPO
MWQMYNLLMALQGCSPVERGTSARRILAELHLPFRTLHQQSSVAHLRRSATPTSGTNTGNPSDAMSQSPPIVIKRLDRHTTSYPFIDPQRFQGALLGRVAVVTGAGRGIGKAIALAFSQAGANVACVSRTRQETNEVVQEIARLGYPKALGICADVSSDVGISEIITETKQTFGAIHILVNNAGLDRIGSLQHDPSFSSWWHVFEVNTKGPVALTRQVLAGMLSQNKGVLIHIGSRNAISNHPFMTAYSASKAALLRFHQCLHLELQGTNVQTFYLQPGDVATSFMHGGIANAEEVKQAPELQSMVNIMQEAMTEGQSNSPRLAADTCVALAALPDASPLSGLYLDATHDLEQMLADLCRGKDSTIKKWELYSLKADIL